MRRVFAVRRLVVVLGVLAAVLLGVVPSASAHAALVRTDPGEGAVVPSAPGSVTLWFSEGVLLSADSLTVYDPAGRRVQHGTAHHAGGRADSATVDLASGLRTGTYTVAWKAVSADTHPVGGAWTFSVGAPSRTTRVPRAAGAGGGAAGTLYGIGRYAAYLGFALTFGTAAFLGVCWPAGSRLRPLRRLAVTGWAVAAGATIALLLLRGPYADGTGLGAVFDIARLRATAGTPSGEALLCRLLLLAAAAVVLSLLFGARSAGAERRTGGVVVAVGVVAAAVASTWSLTEHASVGPQTALAMPLDVAHLLAVAVWLGGLAALLTGLYRTPGVPAASVRRFARIAFWCVCVLVATGVYQSWRQVGSWHALTGTSYGRWLTVKVLLVACVVALAAGSRRRVARLARATAGAPAERPAPAGVPATAPVRAGPADVAAPGPSAPGPAEPPAPEPPVGDPVRAAQLARQRVARERAGRRRERDADPERRGLRRSVLAEAAVAVVVLAVTTVLSGTETGRAAEQAATPGRGGPAASGAGGGDWLATVPFDTGGPQGRGTLGLHLAPARAGADEMHLVISDPSGDPRDVPEVGVAFTLPARHIGPLPVRLRHTGRGAWEATGLQLPMAGAWQVEVTVRTSQIDEVTVTRKVAIGG